MFFEEVVCLVIFVEFCFFFLNFFGKVLFNNWKKSDILKEIDVIKKKLIFIILGLNNYKWLIRICWIIIINLIKLLFDEGSLILLLVYFIERGEKYINLRKCF